MRLIRGYTCKRVIGVDKAPVLAWGTVIGKWIELLEGSPVVKVEPLASSTVKIL
jgi:hypothetical protein